MSSFDVAVGTVPACSTRQRYTVQIAVAALLALSMASYFWIDSRYPALIKKLHVGKSIRVTGAISFDSLLPVTPSMPLAARVGRTTVNWMWTNRIGMAFGVCFGAAMLTLLPLLPKRRFHTAAGDTMFGAVLGTPLGVCANCVAPIGQGLVEAGASTHTVLATMFSSPLLNVVVLAMAFSLFPLPIALTRLAVPLVLLALVPLIAPTRNAGLDIQLPAAGGRGVAQDAGMTVARFLKNLARIASITVPLMLLAAFLGAVTAEALPAHDIPATASLVGIVLIALVGTFLPVPMAFDVALAFVLMTRGVPLPYVVTLLCTLGAFSIFPFLIVGRSLSWRTATAMFAVVMSVGIVAGIGTVVVERLL
jgi:uncharacterized membrane protein YraQ (UPF0718 family)